MVDAISTAYASRLIFVSVTIAAVVYCIDEALASSGSKDTIPYRDSWWMKIVVMAAEVAVGVVVSRMLVRMHQGLG